MKLRLEFECSHVGVFPRTTQVRIIFILVITLTAWAFGGLPAVHMLLTGI